MHSPESVGSVLSGVKVPLGDMSGGGRVLKETDTRRVKEKSSLWQIRLYLGFEGSTGKKTMAPSGGAKKKKTPLGIKF